MEEKDLKKEDKNLEEQKNIIPTKEEIIDFIHDNKELMENYHHVSCIAALAQMLIDKGIIDEDEYVNKTIDYRETLVEATADETLRSYESLGINDEEEMPITKEE